VISAPQNPLLYHQQKLASLQNRTPWKQTMSYCSWVGVWGVSSTVTLWCRSVVIDCETGVQ
jgi:hypothetical protein